MTSRFIAGLAVAFTFLTTAAAWRPAEAQTSLGWGQHVSRYGSGYVGNAPNTIPMTSYYRSPGIAVQGQAATSFYAPTVGVPTATVPTAVAPAGYSPAVSYRVGTPNAAAYTSAYSPIVTPTTPYAANWQYPPQTVMPTVANYAPAPPVYTTNYASVPVTYYRPVTVLSPTGIPQTVLQPCTGGECQAQRRHHGFFSWLFHHHREPAPATVTSYPCHGQPAPVATPYYVPGPATTVAPLGTGAVNVPANVAPSLGGPPPVGASTTIGPSTIIPPSQFGSGAQRAEYPPADAYYPPASTTFPPNVSPPTSAGPLAPFAPAPPASEKALPGPESEPADETPSLNRPGNAPTGSGVQKEGYQEGAQLQYRGPYPVQTQQPRAVIRRESNITPIPDPEYPSGTRAKVNKAPQLLKPSRDRTAQAAQPEARLATFEQEPPAVKLATPAPRKVLGDDIWRSAK